MTSKRRTRMVGGALDLPAGAWSIVGITGLGANDLRVRCRLEAWVDGASQVLNTTTAWTTDGLGLPVTVAGAYESSKPFRTAVVCNDGGYEAYWHQVKITATQVGEVHTLQLH